MSHQPQHWLDFRSYLGIYLQNQCHLGLVKNVSRWLCSYIFWWKHYRNSKVPPFQKGEMVFPMQHYLLCIFVTGRIILKYYFILSWIDFNHLTVAEKFCINIFWRGLVFWGGFLWFFVIWTIEGELIKDRWLIVADVSFVKFLLEP